MVQAVVYVPTGDRRWNAYCLGQLIGEVTCAGRKALLCAPDGDSMLFRSLERLEEVLEEQGQKELQRQCADLAAQEAEAFAQSILEDFNIDWIAEDAAAA